MTTEMGYSVFLLFLFLASGQAHSNLDILPDKAFYREGDLNIGGFAYVQGYALDTLCSDSVMFLPTHQIGHKVAFILEQYNKRDDILPNVTLGFAILDECFRDIPAMPRFLQLLPVLNKSADPMTSLTVGRHYDVVGIVGPLSDTPNIIMGTMAGFFQIPQISAVPSYELSDKVRFPYYFRTIPPDQYQSYALVKMAKELKWEYISVVYVESDYGFNGNRFISNYAHQEGLCIEESYGLGYGESAEKYEATVQALLNGRSRVVVIFTYARSLWNLMIAVRKLDVSGQLIFIIPVRISYADLVPYLPELRNSFHVQFNDVVEPEFREYYESMNPWNTPDEPWLPMIWEQFYDCKMNPKDQERDCHDFPNMTGIPDYVLLPLASRYGDAAHAFAHALHALIEDHCKHAVGSKEKLRACVKPEMLTTYLKNVDIALPYGRITFNDDHDNLRVYVFKQVQEVPGKDTLQPVTVGTYDLLNENISISSDLMQWPEAIPKEKYNIENVPESVCSYPCNIGEMYIQGEVPCCWECKQCRDNEITAQNQTTCTICEELTWPEPEANFTSCSPIPASYLTWGNIYAIGLITCAGSGFIAVVLTFYVVLKYKDRRVIKGSSRELVIVILVGILLAFLTIPAFIGKPTDFLCIISRNGFSISSSLIFAPLFIKSVRIYRVFAASARFEQSVKWIGITSQIVFMCITLGIQVS